MARPQLGVGVVLFDADERVLLIQRGQMPSLGSWTIPGGRVEFGETLETAALRELRSETGLAAELGPMCEVYEYIDPDYHYVVLDYLARSPVGELRADDDAAAARFVALSDLASLPTTPGLAGVLAQALSRYRAWSATAPTAADVNGRADPASAIMK